MSASGFNTTRLLPQLEEVHDRLASVTIERLGWSTFIKGYDRTETLFYLDPPYWGCEDDYGKELFAREDFTAMADQLANIKGGFVMSLNDLPPVRKVFAAFTQAQVGTSYSMSSTKNKKVNELIITNRARYLSKTGLKALENPVHKHPNQASVTRRYRWHPQRNPGLSGINRDYMGQTPENRHSEALSNRCSGTHDLMCDARQTKI